MNDRPAEAGNGERLRLRAEDATDLGIVAACLQDAVVRRRDMGWQRRRRRFAMLANRYMWERKGGFRIRCGLHFDSVLRAQASGMEGIGDDAVLNLLTIGHEPLADDRQRLTLVFAGGPLVRLETECIDVSLDDIGEPWATPRHPDHGGDSGAEGGA